MSEQPSTNPPDLDLEQARLAYSIIETLLAHATATTDLIALMAQALDQETTKALTNTTHWSNYLESRRSMEQAKANIDKFVEIMRRLSED
jgi:hypothetical protein